MSSPKSDQWFLEPTLVLAFESCHNGSCAANSLLAGLEFGGGWRKDEGKPGLGISAFSAVTLLVGYPANKKHVLPIPKSSILQQGQEETEGSPENGHEYPLSALWVILLTPRHYSEQLAHHVTFFINSILGCTVNCTKLEVVLCVTVYCVQCVKSHHHHFPWFLPVLVL